MTQFKILQVLNLLLLGTNAVIFFLPKRLNDGNPSNAAGGFAVIALAILVILVADAVLLGIAIYYRKLLLLQVLSFVMAPASMLFWYLIFRYTHF